ncbi:putative F-box domain, leucine-rich repeat domain superfamily, F-box-like domain superfamily [Helianthus annuus]|nr:putative F-box domain, leucine-rich repeat domain superfamily, F-box-like domain superfamily [Helianthus annuus]
MALEASRLATEDVISSMPDNVITHILDRLPVQDAVKTSILSRNWRFKWTTLSQLVFDDNFLKYLSKYKWLKKKFGLIISNLLLNHKGNITKFFLYFEESCFDEVDEGNVLQWILFLSGKGVKDITIWKMFLSPFQLPTHLFSCSELTHLKLFYCSFHPPPNFRGFPNLLSLEFSFVEFDNSKFGEFITQCPLLEILNMRNQRHIFEAMDGDILDTDTYYVGKVKLVEIAKLANLKRLSLSLCETEIIRDSRNIFEFTGFFPKLQQLNLDFVMCKLAEDGAKTRCPTTFPCLTALELSTINLDDGVLLSCALELIRSCPNLQTLEISANDLVDLVDDPTPAVGSPEVDYNTTTELLQLRTVDISVYKGSENEVCLIKYLLACSPFLKKFVVRLHSDLSYDEKWRFFTKLSMIPQGSVAIDLD